VRRNGHAAARTIAAGVGQVEVVGPGVDDRRVDPATGQRQQFQSLILPRWCRRSPKVAAVLSLWYLHGLSSSDFVPALTELLCSAAGLSAWVITRLCQQWQAEREAFQRRDRKVSTSVRQVDQGFVVLSGSSSGWLIQAMVGSFGGAGGLRTNRSGWAA
jgi:hypothetical protein